MELTYFCLISLVAVTNLFYFWMSSILEDKGHNFNYWNNHLKIYYQFFQLTINEKNRNLRLKYIALFSSSIFLFGLFIYAVFKLMQMDGI